MEKIIEFPEARVIEQEAAEWIVRLERSEKPSPQETAELNQWIKRSSQHRRILIRYATLWNDMDLLSALMLFEPMRAGRSKAFRRLMRPMRSFVANLRRGILSLPRIPAASALLLVATVCLSPFIFDAIKGNENKDLVTAVGEQLSRNLSDGSTLWLNTDSRVHVDYGPGARRVVLERGEAFFKVAKDSERPFEVRAGSRLIRAVGTAFSVRRLNESVQVIVTEGKVALAAVRTPSIGRPDTAAPNAGGIQELGTLKVGQSVALSEAEPAEVKADNIVLYGKQELKRHFSWRDGVLVFAGEPLSEVVEEVSRYTPLQIDIADPELQGVRIGGRFKIGETAALFDALEKGFGLDVSYRDNTHVEIRGSR